MVLVLEVTQQIHLTEYPTALMQLWFYTGCYVVYEASGTSVDITNLKTQYFISVWNNLVGCFNASALHGTGPTTNQKWTGAISTDWTNT